MFSVIEKDRWHRSNLYNNAPMYFMQRITWSGIAMHEGLLPGYPASHGCIRLPREFAARLWPTTRLGVRVFIARSELTPVDFQHPALFSPAAKPSEPKVASLAATERPEPEAAPVRLAQASTVVSDAVGRGSDRARHVTVTRPAERERARSEPRPDELAFGPGDLVAAPVDAAGVAPPLELRKAVEAPQTREPASHEPPSAPAATGRVASSDPAAAEGDEPVKPAPSLTDRPKPPAPRTRASDAPPKRTGQVAVFVSRKEKKIFVRHGFVPLFDMPITITEPDRRLGTYVFTAIGFRDDGAGMRWNLVSMPEVQRRPRMTGAGLGMTGTTDTTDMTGTVDTTDTTGGNPNRSRSWTRSRRRARRRRSSVSRSPRRRATASPRFWSPAPRW